jgi:pilus assembly protein Flp/PilA
MIKFLAACQRKLSALHSEDRGASAVEYALLVGLIAVVVIVAITAVGSSLSNTFNGVASHLSTP